MNQNNQKRPLRLDIVKVTENVTFELEKSKITLPPNYSAANALQAAILMLRTQTMSKTDKRLVMDVCNHESIQRALFSMCIQGLNPLKEQCYFIPYAGRLTLSRSYLGSIAVAKRVDSEVYKVPADVIYAEDEFEFEIVNGMKKITRHKQTIRSMMTQNIVGAYATVLDQNRNPIMTEIMDFTRIKQAWRNSRANPILADGSIDPKSTHGKYPERMAKRTVINRICKEIISTSDDETLLVEALATSEEMTVDEEIRLNANKLAIDFKAENQTPPIDISHQTIEPGPDDISPKTIDFEDDIPDEPEIEYAGKEDCRVIWDLNHSLGRTGKGAVLAHASMFYGDDIDGLSKLPAEDARRYIADLRNELSNQKKSAELEMEPDWG